jgi:hypothetical protein
MIVYTIILMRDLEVDAEADERTICGVVRRSSLLHVTALAFPTEVEIERALAWIERSANRVLEYAICEGVSSAVNVVVLALALRIGVVVRATVDREGLIEIRKLLEAYAPTTEVRVVRADGTVEVADAKIDSRVRDLDAEMAIPIVFFEGCARGIGGWAVSSDTGNGLASY